jgi:hypothetical protein
MITPRRRTNHGDASGARPTSADTAGAAGTATTMPLHSESSSAAAAATGDWSQVTRCLLIFDDARGFGARTRVVLEHREQITPLDKLGS